MSIRKRILALVSAGAVALLGGAVLHTATPTFAALPTNGAVGCVNSPTGGAAAGAAALITFPTQPGSGLINGAQNVTAGTNASGVGFLNILATPGTAAAFATCGALLQDTDAVPADTTVDGGNLTATVTGPILITQSNGPSWSWTCGAAAAAGNDTCQGVVYNGVSGAAGTTVSPTVANTFQVTWVAGTSLGAIGTVAPIANVTVTYTRFAAAGGGTFQVGQAQIAVVGPFYILATQVSQQTVSAALPSASLAQNAANTSTITTLHYRATATPCATGIVAGAFGGGLVCGPGLVGGGVPGPVGIGAALVTPGAVAFFQPGVEPGVDTYQISPVGIWVGSSQTGGTLALNSGAQTIAVQCGTQPATNPLLLAPAIGQAFNLGLASCVQTSATAAGNGAAGAATIVISFIGDYTGTGAQTTTSVTFIPGPATVNLTTGCNEVITPASLAPGSNSAAVLRLVGGFNVTSIWIFNNALHTFQAFYFSTAGAPTDISVTGPGLSIFICGTGAGTFQVSP